MSTVPSPLGGGEAVDLRLGWLAAPNTPCNTTTCTAHPCGQDSTTPQLFLYLLFTDIMNILVEVY